MIIGILMLDNSPKDSYLEEKMQACVEGRYMKQ